MELAEPDGLIKSRHAGNAVSLQNVVLEQDDHAAGVAEAAQACAFTP